MILKDSLTPNNLGFKTGKIPSDEETSVNSEKYTTKPQMFSKDGSPNGTPNHTGMVCHFECFKGNMKMSICVKSCCYPTYNNLHKSTNLNVYTVTGVW